MFGTLRAVFLGLSWFFGGLAVLFMIYVLIVNPREFFNNVMNPLWLVYFAPAIVCAWGANWAQMKRREGADTLTMGFSADRQRTPDPFANHPLAQPTSSRDDRARQDLLEATSFAIRSLELCTPEAASAEIERRMRSLDVESQQVVPVEAKSGGRGLACQASVRSMPVVAV